MSSITAYLLSAVLFTIAPGQEQPAHGSCDAGKLAAALNSRSMGGVQLLGLCSKQFPEAVCFAAGQSLKSQFSSKESLVDVSLEQFASRACSAIEAAAAQQQNLLLRQQAQAPREAPSAAKAQELADIRSSATAHQLSLDVANRYRGSSEQGASATNTDSDTESSRDIGMVGDGETLDDVLHHKSLPIPHGRFGWELNHSIVESTGLENAVREWKKAHMEAVDIKRPEVIHRANFFKKYTNRGAYATVKVPGPSAPKVDVSMQSEDSVKEALSLPGTYESVKEKPVVLAKKSFLASGSELREVIAKVSGTRYS